MHARNVLLAALALAAFAPLHAQSTKEGGPLYKLEINFRDGNDANSMTDRRYTMLVRDGRKTVFKVGTRSPAVTSSMEPETASPAVNTQFTYLDVGVNIDCMVLSAGSSGSKVAIQGNLDLSNIAGDSTIVSGVRNPVIRQTRLTLDGVLEMGKPTVLASIDDPLTARKLQVEATVTKAD